MFMTESLFNYIDPYNIPSRDRSISLGLLAVDTTGSDLPGGRGFNPQLSD